MFIIHSPLGLNGRILGHLIAKTGHYAPKTSHKKTPQKRGLVAEKTCDAMDCYQARPGK
jgi:hypothetical protein